MHIRERLRIWSLLRWCWSCMYQLLCKERGVVSRRINKIRISKYRIREGQRRSQIEIAWIRASRRRRKAKTTWSWENCWRRKSEVTRRRTSRWRRKIKTWRGRKNQIRRNSWIGKIRIRSPWRSLKVRRRIKTPRRIGKITIRIWRTIKIRIIKVSRRRRIKNWRSSKTGRKSQINWN